LAPANVSVTSFHYDPTLTGQNLQETALTPANVNANTFGKLASVPVDGYTYATPLYVADLMIGDTPHNVAFVATEHDSVYAFDIVNDATSPTGTGITQLWQRSFINPSARITTVPSGDVGSGDIVPEIGITGSPVIDPVTNTLYVVAKTKEVRSDGNHYVQKLYALDITTGADRTAPYTIGDSHGGDGFANQTSVIQVAGSGADSGGGQIRFNAFREHQRPSLQLLDGRVYVGWASHGDNGPYHGWVVGFNETTLQPEKWFNTSPNARGSGIWQSQGAISTDGTYLYFAIGNAFNGPNPGFDLAHGNYSEAVLRVDPRGPGTTMTVSNTPGDYGYFVPNDWRTLDSSDADLGSGGVMLLPNSVGSAAHPHLMVETGKTGKIYLIDRDNLGGNVPQGQADPVVQVVTAGPAGVWGNPAFYQESGNSGLIYYHGSGADTRAFRITGGVITPASPTYHSGQNFGFPGAQPIISGNGSINNTAVDWELQVDNYGSQGLATLHAYAARPAASSGTLPELYNSNMTGQRDRLTSSVKFTSATETNGSVLVAEVGSFSVFGLFPVQTDVPPAPTNLVGTGVTATAIRLTWSSPNPNTATGLEVFRSIGDNLHYAQLTTIPAAATTYNDTGLSPGGVYFYKIQATNAVGNSNFSNEIQVAPLIAPPVLSADNIASNRVSLSWTRPPVANDHYDIERSTNPDFTTFTTIAAGLPGTQVSSVDADPTLVSQPGQYFYRIRGFLNPAGTLSALSNLVAARVGPGSAIIDYSGGFPLPPAVPYDLQANGSAAFADTTARLTNGSNQTGSVFSLAEENILNWTTSFSVRLHEGTEPNFADGWTFVLQAVSPGALGQGSGGLGYQGIGNSVAIKFDTFNNEGESGSGGSTGFFYGGDKPTVPHPAFPGEVDLPLDADMVNLLSQSVKQVTLSYAYDPDDPASSVLHEEILDPDHPSTPFTHDYTVDIPSLLGAAVNGNTIAYVGFTGSTGDSGFWQLQDVLNWQFTPTGPAAPHNLNATSGDNFNTLSWNSTSADEQGYYVERSTSPATGFERIAALDAGVTSYVDGGLNNPPSFFYRVQAFNDAGTSGYSNVASGSVVSIPYATGFSNHVNLTANSNPIVNVFGAVPTVLRLTDGRASEATSVFYDNAVGTGAFSTTFTLKDQPVGGAADGLSFVLQHDPAGLSALGTNGGGEGYAGINGSMALKFDLYTHGTHNPSTGLFFNGQSPDGSPAQDVALTGINLGSGDPLLVTVTYDGDRTLVETVRDTLTGANFSHTYALTQTLAQTLGSNSAYVGFTAGTGGESADQDILNWSGQFSTPGPLTIDHSFGFANRGDLTTSGNTTFVGTTARLTNGGANQASALFSNSEVGTGAFRTTFTLQDHGVTGAADSASFVVQHAPAGAGALGANGGGGGYAGIVNSIALKFDQFTHGTHDSSTGLFFNGQSPGSSTAQDVALTGIDLDSGDPLLVTVTYDGNLSLTETVLDTVTSVTFDHTYTLPQTLAQLTGGYTAYVGFTAGTGGETSNQDILEWSGQFAPPPLLGVDHAVGFSSHGDLTANGNAAFSGTSARLTDGGTGQASSIFSRTPIDTGAFSTTFTLKDQPVTGAADNLCFVVQDDPRGTGALGGGGGGGGYAGIIRSIAIKFDLYTHGTHNSSTGLFTNGQSPDSSTAQDVALTPINLASNDTLLVTITYDGSHKLIESVQDTVTNALFTHTYVLTQTLSQIIGGSRAFVGFTAATGGESAIQDILSWSGRFYQATPLAVDHASGFAAHGDLTANGSTTFAGAAARITNGGGGQAGTLFSNQRVPISNFVTAFTFQMRPGTNPIADGLTFIIQADPRGVTALGDNGGSMGYARDDNSGDPPAIVNSVAIKFDAYKGFNGPDGNHSSTGLYVDGHRPNNPPNALAGDRPVDLAGTPIDFNAAAFANPPHSFRATLSYDGTTLHEVITDLSTNMSFSHDYVVDVAAFVGSDTAYVGFGGGTGGLAAVIDVQDWTFSTVQPTTQLGVAGPSTAIAGSAVQVTVTALDASNIRTLGYTGTVTFSSTDPQAVLPADYTFTTADASVHSFLVTGRTAGAQTITVRDAATGTIVGTVTITDTPAATATFVVDGFPSPVTAGTTASVTVTAEDAYGNTATGYTGTVHFTSSDPQAVLPDDATLTNGIGTFDVTLKTAGTQSFTATDTSDGTITGSVPVTVVAAAADHFLVTGSAADPDVAGTPFDVTVTAQDAYGNTVTTGYTGTVHFSSADPHGASLPDDYTFQPGDNGQATFPSGATLFTAGTQDVTVTDAVNSLTGSASVTVVAAAADHFAVTTSATNPDVAGTPFDVTVTVQDAYGNTVTDYTGTVHFSSADPHGASLPDDYTFQASDNGQVTFTGGATLYTAGIQDVTVTDAANNLSGTTNVTVVAGSAVAFVVQAPATAASGTPFDVTIIAVDAYGNTDMNYAGTIHFTTSDNDPGVVLPADYTFQPGDAGMITFPAGVTLITPGDQTLTIADLTSGITGSTTVTVL
jgi:hypothetical protein